MILIDTSGILAAIGADERHHEACAQVMREVTPPRILSPFVLAETDYMIQKYAGVQAELEFLNEVTRGVYQLIPMDSRDVDHARDIVSRYRDLAIGLADASIVVLAERYRCWDVLTLDRRHFRALRTDSPKRPFRIFPAGRL